MLGYFSWKITNTDCTDCYFITYCSYTNNTLNTLYLRFYGIGHIVKDLGDGHRGNPLPPLHGLLFLISSKQSFTLPTNRMVHTTAFILPVVEHWLEREITQWNHHDGSIQRPIAPRADALPRFKQRRIT